MSSGAGTLNCPKVRVTAPAPKPWAQQAKVRVHFWVILPSTLPTGSLMTNLTSCSHSADPFPCRITGWKVGIMKMLQKISLNFVLQFLVLWSRQNLERLHRLHDLIIPSFCNLDLEAWRSSPCSRKTFYLAFSLKKNWNNSGKLWKQTDSTRIRDLFSMFKNFCYM